MLENQTQSGSLDSAIMQRDKVIEHAHLLALANGGIVSGSVIVNRYTAADVDIFIPNDRWAPETTSKIWIEKYRLEPYDPVTGTEEYKQASDLGEIMYLYRNVADMNVIIVSTHFWPAYLAAHRELSSDPIAYADKDIRHNLFIRSKNIIRHMMGLEERELKGVQHNGDDHPW